jgi:hypothetical protein
MRVLCDGKMTQEELQAKMSRLRSEARDLDCLRNEMKQIKPDEEYQLSEASLRALQRIRKKWERYADD